MYQACISDLDGALADMLGSIVYFGNSALVECGYPAIDREKYHCLIGKGPDPLTYGMLQEVLPGEYTEDGVILLRKIYKNLYKQDPMYSIDQYDGMEEVLRDLKSHGAELGVLPSKPHNITTRLTTMMYSSRLFNVYYGQRFNVKCKSSPGGAPKIARELGVEPKNCLYIGGNDTDTQAGIAAGVDIVGVLWGFRCRNELEKSQANCTIREPKEILSIVLGGAAVD